MPAALIPLAHTLFRPLWELPSPAMRGLDVYLPNLLLRPDGPSASQTRPRSEWAVKRCCEDPYL